MSKTNSNFAKQMKGVNRKGEGTPMAIHKSLQDAIRSTTKDMAHIHDAVDKKIKAGIAKERSRFSPKT